MKHTQGPWLVEKYGENMFKIDSSNEPIATLQAFNTDSLSNANLIAAAPELLSTLQTILFGLTDDVTNNGGKIDFDALIGLCKTAIKKAHGE